MNRRSKHQIIKILMIIILNRLHQNNQMDSNHQVNKHQIIPEMETMVVMETTMETMVVQIHSHKHQITDRRQINKNHIIRELHLATGQGPDVFIDNTPSSYTAQLNCVCHQRGFYDIPLIKVDSIYPLGLIRAFSYFSIEEKVLVYPKPQSCEYMLQKDLNRSSFDSSRQQVHSTRSHGNDEISGLKNYRPGDAVSLIDWKQLAKGKGLMVKDFSADESMDMYLTENSIKSRELEEQISMLTYAVIDLTRRDIQFGFRFREINIQPGNGFEHQQYILRRLALY